jgi:RNA polymerase sigma-70 factor (ECF subfamily)
MADAADKGQRESGDREWMARFLAGDREAFTRVYRLHSPAVFRFALHMTGDRMKASETTQDVFVWLVEHAGNFDAARGELGAFLIGVARKQLLRRLQNERRWMPLGDLEAGEASRRPERESENESRADALRAAIAALPERYREVVVLCDLEGNTYESAAAALECAVGTVRSRLHRARELLGRKLHAKQESQRCAV